LELVRRLKHNLLVPYPNTPPHSTRKLKSSHFNKPPPPHSIINPQPFHRPPYGVPTRSPPPPPPPLNSQQIPSAASRSYDNPLPATQSLIRPWLDFPPRSPPSAPTPVVSPRTCFFGFVLCLPVVRKTQRNETIPRLVPNTPLSPCPVSLTPLGQCVVHGFAESFSRLFLFFVCLFPVCCVLWLCDVCVLFFSFL